MCALTIGEVEELTEEELGEHEEYVDMAIETVIEGHSHCASECPEHYHISEDGHGDPSICYRELVLPEI